MEVRQRLKRTVKEILPTKEEFFSWKVRKGVWLLVIAMLLFAILLSLLFWLINMQTDRLVQESGFVLYYDNIVIENEPKYILVDFD